MGPLTQEEADTLREIEKILINPHIFRMSLQGKTEKQPVDLLLACSHNIHICLKTSFT